MNAPRRAGRTLLISLVALLLVTVLAGAAWLLLSTPSLPSPEEGRAVAENFLQDICDGAPSAAWESTTAEFKSAEGRENFIKRVRKTPVLKQPLEFVSMQTVDVGNQQRQEFLYRSDDGKTVRVLVGEELEVWKVDRVISE